MNPQQFLTQFITTDSAASAVRNLNDYEIMGRKLRVDFSNETGTVNEDEGRDRDGAVCNSQNKQNLQTQLTFSDRPDLRAVIIPTPRPPTAAAAPSPRRRPAAWV